MLLMAPPGKSKERSPAEVEPCQELAWSMKPLASC
jgi:hypothetical protein